MFVFKLCCGDVFLIIDMINIFVFEDGVVLVEYVNGIGEVVYVLCMQCYWYKLLVVYVNDNFGQWCQGFEELLCKVVWFGCCGQCLVVWLCLMWQDLFVFKLCYLVFYQILLLILFDVLEVKCLIFIGIVVDFCVLSLVIEVYVCGYVLWVFGNVVVLFIVQWILCVLVYICELFGGEMVDV